MSSSINGRTLSSKLPSRFRLVKFSSSAQDVGDLALKRSNLHVFCLRLNDEGQASKFRARRILQRPIIGFASL